jgi:hypothetical protein
MTCRVDSVPGCKVIRAIQHNIHTGNRLFKAAISKDALNTADIDFRIQAVQEVPGGMGL